MATHQLKLKKQLEEDMKEASIDGYSPGKGRVRLDTDSCSGPDSTIDPLCKWAWCILTVGVEASPNGVVWKFEEGGGSYGGSLGI
ncbi:hypothetical protein AVEN_58324-1 [Araneus ventricosus]|uniref:Uncharacterized protein n=1 Tax=Araneus ventricosus TaxID=182803 RepID=A0A4Y2CQ46_ARAVE|nr:hypothetical protein AVEN_58324-1 [Araneus ventricosus]